VRFARYWLPTVLSFALGAMLSLKMSGRPMRELLAIARAEEGDAAPAPTGGRTSAANVSLGEDDRFARVFSTLQEARALKRRSDLHSAIGDLGSEDLEALIHRVESLKGRLGSNELHEVVLQRWFEIDRAAAEAWIRKRPHLRGYQILWAKADPEAALKAMRQNPDLPWSEDISGAAVDALARGVLSEKARLLLELPDTPSRHRSLISLAHEWAGRDPREAMAFARGIQDQDGRSAFLTNVLERWTSKDVEKAAAEIAARLPEIENGRGFQYLLTSAVSLLARKDVSKAIEWVSSLPEQHRSERAFSLAAQVWAETQPVDALEWCVANGVDASSSFSDAGRGSVVAEAMQWHPAETLRWIQAQPAGAMRDALLERALLTNLPYRGSPTSAQSEDLFQTVQGMPEDSRARVAAGIGRLLGFNYQQSPEWLSSWVERFQDPVARAATITGAAEVNAFRSTGPAKDFAAQFAEGPDRDAALRGMAIARSRSSNKQASADIALRINDPTLQWKTLDGFMVDWLRKDSKAAMQWLNQAPAIKPEWSATWQQEANSAY
jgi:hypothetical protein